MRVPPGLIKVIVESYAALEPLKTIAASIPPLVAFFNCASMSGFLLVENQNKIRNASVQVQNTVSFIRSRRMGRVVGTETIKLRSSYDDSVVLPGA